MLVSELVPSESRVWSSSEGSGRAPGTPGAPAHGGTLHTSLRRAPPSSRPRPGRGGASRGQPRGAGPPARLGAPPPSPARCLAALATENTPRPLPGRPMGARAALWVSPPPPGKLGAEEKFVQRLEGRERSSEPGSQEEEDERSQVRASGQVDVKPPPGRRKQPQWQPPAPIAARAAQG